MASKNCDSKNCNRAGASTGGNQFDKMRGAVVVADMECERQSPMRMASLPFGGRTPAQLPMNAAWRSRNVAGVGVCDQSRELGANRGLVRAQRRNRDSSDW